MAASSENLWKIKLPEGKEYTLSRSEITVSALRHFKQKFGAPYGKFLPFVQLLMEGDADAWCCALWLVQRNAGENPKPPEFMDFSVGEVMLSGIEEDAARDAESGEDPTMSELSGQTDG